MKPRVEALLEMCIDSGIALGYTRAHKHTERPSEDAVQQAISAAIMHEIYDWFQFDNCCCQTSRADQPPPLPSPAVSPYCRADSYDSGNEGLFSAAQMRAYWRGDRGGDDND